MKQDIDKCSLVLVGKWNTAILSPDWLAEHVFEAKEVQILYPVLGGGPPIFQAADIRIVVSKERIMFVPLKDEENILTRIENAAIHVLETLPYTPISAFGENFYYDINNPPSQLSAVFNFSDADQLDLQGDVIESSVRRTINVNGCRLNITLIHGDIFKIEMNYHFEVNDARNATELMKNTYIKNKTHGLSLLKTVYDLTLEEDTNYVEKSD